MWVWPRTTNEIPVISELNYPTGRSLKSISRSCRRPPALTRKQKRAGWRWRLRSVLPERLALAEQARPCCPSAFRAAHQSRQAVRVPAREPGGSICSSMQEPAKRRLCSLQPSRHSPKRPSLTSLRHALNLGQGLGSSQSHLSPHLHTAINVVY